MSPPTPVPAPTFQTVPQTAVTPNTSSVPTANAAAPTAPKPIGGFPATNTTAPTAPPASTVPSVTTTPVNSTTLSAEDALGRGDMAFMRQRVQTVVGAIVAVLEPALRTRVEHIPLVFDPSRTEVNAYATCSRASKPAVIITDAMLVLTANLSQLKAVDEVFGTRWSDEYARYVAQNQQANTPLLSPPVTWVTTAQASHRSTLARQLQLFDEMIAFVFGHELAHHYLNHLPCTSLLPLDASEIGLVVTDTIPAFNQPNEAAADVAGIRNLLKAEPASLGHSLSENGALAQLRFFGALDNARPIDVFTFERTHPPPSVREPIVTAAAQAFRATLRVTWPWSN